MDDWKLKARAIVKLKIEDTTLVFRFRPTSLYAVSQKNVPTIR